MWVYLSSLMDYGPWILVTMWPYNAGDNRAEADAGGVVGFEL